MPSVTTSMRVARRDFRAEAHAQADRLADLLAERRRHASRRRARGEPSRLQHEDLFARRPGLVDQHQRHARRLAGAGRRDQHGGVIARQGRDEIGQHGVDRKRRRKTSHRSARPSGGGLSPDAHIGEAVPGDFLRPVDVAQVDDHRPRHRLLELVEIERAELLPFGDDDQRIGAFGAAIGAVAIGRRPSSTSCACSMPSGS